MSLAVRFALPVLALLCFLTGCTGAPSTQVLNGKIAEDPSLGSEYSGETGGDPLAAEPKQPKPSN